MEGGFIVKGKFFKKLAATMLSLVMCLSLMQVTAFALPVVPNVAISSEGILTWDDVPGAVSYDVDFYNVEENTIGTYEGMN